MSLPFSVEEMLPAMAFHGPLMAGIREIKGIGTNGIAGDLMPSVPQKVSRQQGTGRLGYRPSGFGQCAADDHRLDQDALGYDTPALPYAIL